MGEFGGDTNQGGGRSGSGGSSGNSINLWTGEGVIVDWGWISSFLDGTFGFRFGDISFSEGTFSMSLGVSPQALFIPAVGAGNLYHSRIEAGMAAIDSKGLGFKVEDAGTIFQNPDKMFGYTDPMDPRNTAVASAPGGPPPGTTLAGFWHLHPGSGPFNQNDTQTLNLYGVPGFLGGADGSIRMYLPATGREYILRGR